MSDDNVVMLEPRSATAAGSPSSTKSDSEVTKIWSKPVLANGFSIVPSVIFKAQQRLGLSPQHLNVLLQIISHWWTAAELPFPSKATLAKRMSCSPRQVQRYLKDLEANGLITRRNRKSVSGAQLSNYFAFDGLIAKLKEISKDFDAERKDRAQRKRELEGRGGRKLREKLKPGQPD